MDSFKNALSRLSEPVISDRNAASPNLANGGHTGFVPVQGCTRRKSRVSQLINRILGEESEEEGQNAYAGAAQQQPPQFQQQYDPGFVQQFPQAQQPPEQARQFQRTGMGSVAGTQGQTANLQPAQDFQPYAAPPQPQQPAPSVSGRFGSRQQLSQPMNQNTGAGQAEQPSFNAPQAQPNVIPMQQSESRVFQGEDGLYYRHIEDLTTITRLADCYYLMEQMLKTHTIVVCMDMIQDERERQRCADLLFGAAYSMNCSLSRISITNTYMIAPRAVLVHASRNMNLLNQKYTSVLWPGSNINGRGSYEGEEATSRRARPFRPADTQDNMNLYAV